MDFICVYNRVAWAPRSVLAVYTRSKYTHDSLYRVFSPTPRGILYGLHARHGIPHRAFALGQCEQYCRWHYYHFIYRFAVVPYRAKNAIISEPRRAHHFGTGTSPRIWHCWILQWLCVSATSDYRLRFKKHSSRDAMWCIPTCGMFSGRKRQVGWRRVWANPLKDIAYYGRPYFPKSRFNKRFKITNHFLGWQHPIKK